MTERNDDPTELGTGLWEALQDPDQAGALVGLGFDFLLSQPVSRYVTPERVLEQLDAALRPAQVERVVCTHLRAFYDRERERSKARGDRVRDYLTDDARKVLRELLAQPVTLDREFLEQFVRQDAIRHLLRSIVQETVQRFVQALKPGGKNGLLGQLPRGPGMGLLTKMAGQMEGHIQKAASAFVSQSLEVLLGRLVHILSTPETADQLGRLRAQGFDSVLPLHTRTLWKLAHQLPLDELLGLVSPLISHNLARDELRQTVLAEARAVLEVEGPHPLSELLDPDAVKTWRAMITELGGPLLTELLATEQVRKWLAHRG